MKKKILIFGAAALMSVTTLLGATSCNGTSSSQTSSEDKVNVYEVPFDTTKEIKINFYHTMGQALQEVFEMYLEDFNDKYPNIKVKHTSVGNYDDVRDQLTTEISSQKPDGATLTYCYPDHIAMYNQAKSVVPLDGFIDSQIKIGNTNEIIGLTDAQLDDYVDKYYEEGNQFGDGKMYSLPFSKSSEILYYNKTEFNRLNLSVPDHWFSTGANDTTSVEYACKKIKEANPDSTPLGYDSGANWFITMCEQTGAPYTSALGDHYLFNNAQTKEFVSKFVEWRERGYVTTKAILGSYTSSSFTNKELYMCIGSSAGASYQQPADNSFEVGIATVPQHDATNHKAVIQQGPSVCIFNNNDPQVVIASWLLLKFFTLNADFQAQFSLSSGYTPVIKSVEENEAYAAELAKDGIQARAIKQCLAQKDYYFISPAFVGSSKAREQAENIMTRSLNKEDTLDNIFADAIMECTKN